MSTNTTAPAGGATSTESGKAPKYSFCIHGQPMCNKCAESADFGENYVREWATYWRNRAISAEAQLAAERKRWEAVVFDGWRVLQGLDEHARKRTSHQNVSDTLDALVRVMKPNTKGEQQ